MGKNDNEKKAEQQESNLSGAQKKEAWLKKNSGLLLGLGAFVLIAIACLVMKLAQ